MEPYIQLISNILTNGIDKNDRTGTGTKSIFGWQMRFNLSKGFPLLTTKKLHFKSIAYELLWFIRGDSNIKFLNENGVSIWNEWADEDGELGPVYGKQWRKWETSNNRSIDQLSNVINDIKENPFSRRLIISAWNPEHIGSMALPPCHCLFQFYVSQGKLSCQLYQRSADVFLGIPFNIASYALLTEMIAKVCNLKVGDFIISLGDAHLYADHIDLAQKQILRKPRKLPLLKLNSRKSIDEFSYEDMEIIGYDPHPHISAKVSI